MYKRINNHSIFAFSDTHGQHRDLKVPEKVDILICAGDAVEDDLKGDEYDDFIEWFSSINAKWKFFIPGNHELSFENDQSEMIREKMKSKGILVLQDSLYECEGVVICSISANAMIEDEDIPTDIDLLVTHYPPYGILDEGLGCPTILNFTLKAKPTYHLFGHIHSTKGHEVQSEYTLFKNICVFND